MRFSAPEAGIERARSRYVMQLPCDRVLQPLGSPCPSWRLGPTTTTDSSDSMAHLQRRE